MIHSWILRQLSRIAPQWAGRLDYYFRPALGDGWGGPFNGQCFRQLLFIDLIQACRFAAIIETGTFRGTTARFMAENTDLPLYSCEVDHRCFTYSVQRLQKC